MYDATVSTSEVPLAVHTADFSLEDKRNDQESAKEKLDETTSKIEMLKA
jgi:hypothetical protein